jgi:hypothetical protein
MLIPKPPNAQELKIDPDCGRDQPQFLGGNQSADAEMPASHKKGVQHASSSGCSASSVHDSRIIGEIVYHNTNSMQLFVLLTLLVFYQLSLLINNLLEGCGVPFRKEALLLFWVYRQSLLNIFFDGQPGGIHIDAGTENINPSPATLIQPN